MHSSFCCLLFISSIHTLWNKLICSKYEIAKTGIYIQTELKKVVSLNLYSFLGLFFVFLSVLSFALSINITKFRFFLFCSDEADMKRSNILNDYDVYVIDLLDESYFKEKLNWNGFILQKKKTLNLKIFISSLFHGKNSWNFTCKFKYSFPIVLY